ncbi:K+dependent Na+ exchanger related-protein [Sphaerochaeta pleomorpha str. Grapes]|uniref:K+dependent Na+ exchanger related-protein n=1 Tax=Sphaerochaeta pleomorpha (strain ATCC BAA-1885 / DSM 22778 / Grapes) TaxID=158190 RepID=G8QUS3_SPHPG|nr:calcium/sodium antiporter [Sphaerochaeta pleomorpha]AEV30381.1 K+dependent Na+ exchanger related-protein [Sphaerochaeta pleomorpha str. Grapes]
MSQMVMYVAFVGGLVLIIKGGDWFVDAASYVAEASGVPKFVVGATVVSFATTLPELMVSSLAMMQGKVDMALGNIVGSVTVNTSFILPLSILFLSVSVKRKDNFNLKVLLFLLSEIVLFAISLTRGASMVKSLALVVMFILYIIENIHSAKKKNEPNDELAKDQKTIILNLAKFFVGLFGIVYGSRLLVDNGSEIARSLGISEAFIALTAISIGTSLPELVTAVSAIIKKEAALSVGNIFGANTLDIVMIIPVCSFIANKTQGVPLPISEMTVIRDLPVCIAVSLVATIPTMIKGKFYKWQGVLLLVMYGAYLTLL